MVMVSTHKEELGLAWSDEEEAVVSSAEENMALARRFMEAQVMGDLDALDDMLAPDFVSHNKLLRGQEPGRENFKRAVSAYHAAVSNPSIHFEDQVAGGDKVVTRFFVGKGWEQEDDITLLTLKCSTSLT